MLQNLFAKKGLDAIFLTKPENTRYFTNFIGTFGFALITKANQKFLITDSRYTEQAKKLCTKDTQIIIVENSFNEELAKLIKKLHIKKIGFESENLSYHQALKLRREHKEQSFVPLSKEVDQLRMVKTANEIKKIQKSQLLNEQTLSQVLKLVKTGISETEIAWQIYKIGRDFGADSTSFDPIIGFGKNSASPHYMPNKNCKLKKGDIVLIDMGLKYEGYCSDMTRTFFTVTPSSQQAEVYNTVLSAQVNALENLQIGATGKTGDELSRSIINKAGYGDFFTHANGHGLGLEIHESPSLSSKTKHKDRSIILAENMVVTVEPGIYLPNKFGIRIEDMVLIQKSKNQNLTKFPKKINEVIIKI